MKRKLIIVGFIIGVVSYFMNPSFTGIVKASLLFGGLTFVALIVERVWRNRKGILASIREERARGFVRGYYRAAKSLVDIDTDVIKIILGTPANTAVVKQLWHKGSNRAFVESLDECAMKRIGDAWSRSEPGRICQCMLAVH